METLQEVLSKVGIFVKDIIAFRISSRFRKSSLNTGDIPKSNKKFENITEDLSKGHRNIKYFQKFL